MRPTGKYETEKTSNGPQYYYYKSDFRDPVKPCASGANKNATVVQSDAELDNAKS